jgi:hypothetical protein
MGTALALGPTTTAAGSADGIAAAAVAATAIQTRRRTNNRHGTGHRKRWGRNKEEHGDNNTGACGLRNLRAIRNVTLLRDNLSLSYTVSSNLTRRVIAQPQPCK